MSAVQIPESRKPARPNSRRSIELLCIVTYMGSEGNSDDCMNYTKCVVPLHGM